MSERRPFSLGWTQPIGRVAYIGWGLGLFALKYAMDATIARFVFDRPWSPIHYPIPSETLELPLLPPEEQIFFGTLVAASLPFLVMGLILTRRRLASARLSGWFVLLFFVPVVNLLFFAILGAIPSRPAEEIVFLPAREGVGVSDDPGTWPQPPPAVAFEGDRPGRGFWAIFGPVPIALAFTWLGSHGLSNYGWGMFLGIPFFLGMTSAVVLGSGRRVGVGKAIGIGQVALLAYGAGLLCLAFEGAICIAMAWPIAAFITLFGSVLGWSFQAAAAYDRGTPVKVILALLIALPAFMGAEHLTQGAPMLFTVRTSVDIDAPPERVWKSVVSFSDIPPPTDWLMRAGIAYPTHAEIEGRGVGAIRRCVFSTGTFVEPIEVWDEPRLLKFSVTSNPPAMREWSPWSGIRPPHLDGFLVSKGGEFRLVPLPNGGTRLVGTTWYHHNMSPPGYWRLYSDFIIHRIHRRVLDHVKHQVESG